MTYENERKRIIETCLLMQKKEFFLGTWGNVSMRVGDRILLTPSKVCYDTMKPEDIVVIDLEGNTIEGDRTPTSEKEVHRQIYVKRNDVNAIVHAHTKHCMALSATGLTAVPCITEEMSQLLGGAIPLTKGYVPAGEHFKLGAAAAEVIADKNGVILKNHGPVACGRDMDEAILVTTAMEKACEIYSLLLNDVKVNPIPENFVESERYRFLYSYGHEKT